MADIGAYPEALQRLAAYLKRLPGVGKRTAERHALSLLDWPTDLLQQFGDEISHLRERVCFCTICGNLADSDECRICRNPDRQRDVICVVEYATQIPVIETSGVFHGLYHVLGGRLVPLEGKGPEDLRIRELHDRVVKGDVRELIIATSSDVEGEATAHFLAGEFETLSVSVSRIASGVPVGADLSYADSATLAMAFGGRRSLR